MSYRLLLLEDDRLFGETIEEFLEEEGYKVDWAQSAKEALDFCYYTRYDLYLFDVKLPDIDGFELLSQLRNSQDNTPTIFITSKKEKEDLLQGFNKGADDYITKPVDLDELLVRIQALLRRSYGDDVIEIDGVRVQLAQMRISKDGKEIELNPKELRLLELFLKNRKKIVTKEQIYEFLWKPEEIISDGALRVYVNTLKKIFGKEAITNIRGVGYKFEK